MHIGGEGRIRTYGPVAQTAALGKAASIRPLSHLSPELDFSAELTPSLLELGISQVGNG